eukprot:TRINITY_DN534_c0_g1_i1.p1 TRINITY_DN534_c0_g1~~TRINITY_DN534_c0_g1_i1.p1  ORF type:complete len:657 (+),score=156.32 TRINITY_DN534_c0_g1_i1:33-2003(+)
MLAMSENEGSVLQERSRTPSVRIGDMAQQWDTTATSEPTTTVLAEVLENSKNDKWDKGKERLVSAVRDFQNLVKKCGIKHKVQTLDVTPRVVADFVKSKRMKGTEKWLSRSMKEILNEDTCKVTHWECAGEICKTSSTIRSSLEGSLADLSHNLPVRTTEDRRGVHMMLENWKRTGIIAPNIIDDVQKNYVNSCQWMPAVEPDQVIEPRKKREKRSKEAKPAAETSIFTEQAAERPFGNSISDSKIRKQLAAPVRSRFQQETGTIVKGGTPAKRAKRELVKKRAGKVKPVRLSKDMQKPLSIDLDVSDDETPPVASKVDIQELLGESLKILTNGLPGVAEEDHAEELAHTMHIMGADDDDDTGYGEVVFETKDGSEPESEDEAAPAPVAHLDHAIMDAFFDRSETENSATSMQVDDVPSSPPIAPPPPPVQDPPSPSLARSQSNMSFSMVDGLLREECSFSLPPASVARGTTSNGEGTISAGQLNISHTAGDKRPPSSDMKVHLQEIKRAKRDQKDLVDLTKSRFDISAFTEADYIRGVSDKQAKNIEVVIIDEEKESVRAEKKTRDSAKIGKSISSAIAYQSSLTASLPPPPPLSVESKESFGSMDVSTLELDVAPSQAPKLTKKRCTLCSKVFKTANDRSRCPVCRRLSQSQTS